MPRNTRTIVVLALLAAMVLSGALSGCSFSLNKEFGGELSLEATLGPEATATPKATAVAAPTSTKAPTAAPAPSKTAQATPMGAAGAQTITQDIVIHNVSSDGTISAETTFTMTASIQVGVVDGINYASEHAPMPQGAEPFDRSRLPMIGDAVQSADGLVVQVHGWETVDADGEPQFVLVDITVGNAGEERQLVATVPCMEIVSGDGHWYSPLWYALYWSSIKDMDYATTMAQDLLDTLLANGITSDLAVALDPGQAARGTAVFPVPKSAKQLAFGFQSYLAATYLMFSNEALPTILVPLGLEGEFTAIPDDVEPLEPGDTYRVGESLEAPERGVSFQIQSAWLRQESLGNMWKLGRDEQFVVVHVIAPTSGDVKPLDQTRELALVDDSGYSYELQEYASDYLTLRLGPHNQRGVLVFKGPRDATGLMLEFNPLDPATMGSDSPEPLEDEAVTIELGELEAAPAVVLQGAEPKPTAKAEPGDEPSGGVHRLGEEVVSGSLAITVNGYESHGGPAGYESGAGRSWMVAYVTVENVGRADVQLYAEQFDFVDAEGGVYNELWNAASVWDDAAPHVLEYHKLAPGDRLEDKVVIIQIEDELIPELKLRYRADDDSYVMWRLSF